MPNPYESPPTSPREVHGVPLWYLWFCKVYWPAWWTGTALVAGSWLNVVSPEVGWIGFGLAGLAALGSYILPSLAGIHTQDYVVLDSRQLQTKDHVYHSAMERFKNGATLMFDGVAFGFRLQNEIACGVVAGSNQMDQASVMDIAKHANNVFNKLKTESAEFAAAVAGRTLRISVMSGFDHNARELCQVVDGKVENQV